ncbi:glycosyltransferase [Streptomyces sp. NPDC006798]|uniref:glycosyltransferase n=1 Tax=Streptomyces sp. NPDC006798 TaxID=3155462 RepID=UPI0033C9F7D6
MRIGLLTDDGRPYASNGSADWCDRLVRGLTQHEFDVYVYADHTAYAGAAGVGRAFGTVGERAYTAPVGGSPYAGHAPAPAPRVRRLRTAPPGPPGGDGGGPAFGRRARRRFTEHFTDLVTAVRAIGAGAPAGAREAAAGFADGLYGLAGLAREHGGLATALRSERAVRIVESGCRAPGAHRSVHAAAVPDYLTFAGELERALRPLSFDWYGDDGLGAVDLCHAVSGGPTALPGLLAKRFCGVPLLVTEYGAELRAHYLAAAGGVRADGLPAGAGAGARGPGATAAGTPRTGEYGDGPAGGSARGRTTGAPGAPGATGFGGTPLSAPVRALLTAFRRALTAEVYAQAALITPGDADIRRWQQKCGADPAKLRTVHPGVPAERYAAVGDSPAPGDPYTLIWAGPAEPGKDLVGLLHAFAEIRAGEPRARLRLCAAPARGEEETAYLAHCRWLAAQLFPAGEADLHPAGDAPVTFERLDASGGPGGPAVAEVCAAGAVVVSASAVEGFPHTLVEAMLCGRATVSTDAGAVVEVIGGTGLVVPPRRPRALADAVLALLGDPERAARLGAAARARALELFTTERNTAAFHALYLEVIARSPVHRETLGSSGDPLPFGCPAEAFTPMRWERGAPVVSFAGHPAAASAIAGVVRTGGRTAEGTVRRASHTPVAPVRTASGAVGPATRGGAQGSSGTVTAAGAPARAGVPAVAEGARG